MRDRRDRLQPGRERGIAAAGAGLRDSGRLDRACRHSELPYSILSPQDIRIPSKHIAIARWWDEALQQKPQQRQPERQDEQPIFPRAR